MKVLQINVTSGNGSAGQITVDIYKVLEKQGHSGLIAYGRKTAPEGINSYKVGTDLDLYYHGIASRVFDRHGFASKNATKNLVKKIKEYNPDIIHLHGINGYYLNVEVLFNYLSSIETPVVWTFHDCWAFTGHCCYFDYVDCNKWQHECHKCPQKKSYPTSDLLDNSKKNFIQKKALFTSVKNMTILSPSNWLAGLLEKSFLNKYPIYVINNGIDLSTFKPTESNFRDKYNLQNKYIILGVASIWDRRKGLDTFIELAKKIDDSSQIVVVGVTKKQKESLPKNIIAIERTSNLKELVEIYTAADVFVNPTLEDNYPTTNLEALACGTPVFTYDTGGSPEVVNVENGKVISKNDFEALLVELKLDKENPMKQNIRVDREKLDKEVSYTKYVEIYRGLIK